MARRIEDILEAIRSLSVEERDRLAERIRREVDDERRSGKRVVVEPKSIIGLFGDDPDLMDRVCEAAMQSRERDPLRQTNG